MLGYKGPAQPSPIVGDALNAGYTYLEVCCLGYSSDIRPRHRTATEDDADHELERYTRCKHCSQVRGYPYKRSHSRA